MSRWRNTSEFKMRVRDWAKKLDVPYRVITLRPMKRKWASYSQKGNLHFDEQLLTMDRRIGDYVIVHELLHIAVPNHGKLWKSLMRAHLGDYETTKLRLDRVGMQRRFRT